MCTVSWIREDDGYQLLCNRDERRTRAVAMLPRAERLGPTTVVTPRDGAAGGSWIAVNEWGVSVCLLNGACLSGAGSHGSVGGTAQSRGTLLLGLAGASTMREICERLWERDLSGIAAFTLLVLEPDLPAAIVEWSGSEKSILLHGEPYLPLTSSSFDPAGAQARRRKEFERLTSAGQRLSAEALYAFHESHGAHADAYSPCMHRPDATTVSFSWIKVTGDAIDFYYTPAAPCRLLSGETTRLARVR